MTENCDINEPKNRTKYNYDEMDRLNKRTDPLGNSESFAYDLNGNLQQATDRKSQITTYSYDGLNRVTGVHFNDGSTISYTWDAGNRLISLADSQSGAISRSYDGLDRLVSETTPQGTVSYTYDADGRRQTMSVSGQSQVSYNFDNASRLTGISQGGSHVSLGYDADSRRTALTLPSGVAAGYSYDEASQLTGIVYQGGSLAPANLAYTYDLAGRRTSVSGTLASTQLPSAVSNAAYNANNQLTQWGSNAMTYDLDGNTLSDGMNSYVWDARNRLVSANSNGATFAYDPLGRRTGKNVLGVNTNFLYDGANPVQELNGSTVTANLLTGGVDEYFTRTDSTGSSNFLSDALGSTAALTDSGGNQQVQYSYGPFGAININGTTNNSYTYTGRETDGLGLYYNRARYYNPATGRFISEDPLGFGGGDVNLYAYVADNPTNFVDPQGTSNSWVHYQVTVAAAEASGMSWVDAQAWALAVIAADFIPGSQGTGMRNTALHSMAGRKDNNNMESCQQAYQEAVKFVNEIDQSGTTIAQLALALHSIEDSYSPSHQYKPWNGHLTMGHIEGDAVIPDGVEAATQQFFRDLLANGKPGSAEKYLNPPSVCNAF